MEPLSQILDRSRSATTTPNSDSDWRPTLDEHVASLTKAANEAAVFIAEMAMGAPGRWLTYSGNPGCGKSMLATQILQEAKRHNPGGKGIWMGGYGSNPRPRPGVIWIDSTWFADSLRSGAYGLAENYADDWLVVFDDLGAARDKSDFVADAIFRFCNSRRDKWTVFTTNLKLDEIGASVDDRVASRLIRDRNHFCRIEAEDYAIVQMIRQSTKILR